MKAIKGLADVTAAQFEELHSKKLTKRQKLVCACALAVGGLVTSPFVLAGSGDTPGVNVQGLNFTDAPFVDNTQALNGQQNRLYSAGYGILGAGVTWSMAKRAIRA